MRYEISERPSSALILFPKFIDQLIPYFQQVYRHGQDMRSSNQSHKSVLGYDLNEEGKVWQINQSELWS